MTVIAPTTAHPATAAAPTLKSDPLGKPATGGGRVQGAEAKAKAKYRGIALSDAKFEDFAFALTGKTAAERTPAENRALAQLRKEMAAGQVDPAFIQADPANGTGNDKLPPGARGAFVAGPKGQPGKVLIAPHLRGQQLQKTSDEEMGEALAARAEDLGIGVADGDAGARVAGVAGGRKVTRDSDPALFKNQTNDTITVLSDGQTVRAEADAGVVPPTVSPTAKPGWVAGGDNQYYNLSTAAGQRAHMKSYDADGSGQLDRTEFHAAMTSIDGNMTPAKADRLMKLYGGTTDNVNYYVPVGPAPAPVWAGTGTDQMFSDGIVQKAPGGGGYVTDLGQVDPATVANAMTRHIAIYHYTESGGQGLPGDWIARFQTNGMTAEEMDWATNDVLGDKKPFDDSNGHRDVVVANFGTNDAEGTPRINTSQLTAAVARGAISIKPGNTSADFVAFSAHREPVGPKTVPKTNLGASSPVTGNYYLGTVSHTNLWTATDAQSENNLPLGIYATPHVRSVPDIAFGGVVGTSLHPISGASMTRTKELDASGKETGNVTWTFAGTQTDGYSSQPVSVTVPAGSKQDRYLQDYKEFSAPLAPGQPGRNMRLTDEVTNADGTSTKVWTPREHQFQETGHTGANTEKTFATPVVTVDGQTATVTAVTPVKQPDGSVTYIITAKTGTKTVTIAQTIKQSAPPTGQQTAFANINAQVNGGNGQAAIDVATPQGKAQLVSIVQHMPPQQAAAFIDSLPVEEGAAFLASLPPTERNAIMAAIPPSELVEILAFMDPATSAAIKEKMPPKLATAVQDTQAFNAVSSNGRNLPNRPNLQQVDTYTDANGNVIEIWAPRDTQFATDATGKTVPKETQPVVSVNGKIVQPSRMFVGQSQVDGVPIIGFEVLNPTTGQAEIILMPVDANASPKLQKTITSLGKAFADSGNLQSTDSLMMNPSVPGFDAMVAFEEDRFEQSPPPRDANLEGDVTNWLANIENDPAVKAEMDRQEKELVETGVMFDGAAMEALGLIPAGQSDPNQIYFVPQSPELQSAMTALGMGDMNKDVLHVVPLSHKGRVLNEKHKVGGAITPLQVTQLHEARVTKKFGDWELRGNYLIKFASLPSSVVKGHVSVPGQAQVGFRAEYTTDEGFLRERVVEFSADAAGAFTVRGGVVKNNAFRRGYQTGLFFEYETGGGAGASSATNETVRPRYDAIGIRFWYVKESNASQAAPAWLQTLHRWTGHTHSDASVGGEARLFFYWEASGKKELKVEFAAQGELLADTSSGIPRAPRGVSGAIGDFLAYSFGYAAGQLAFRGNRNGNANAGGAAVAEAVSMGLGSFSQAAYQEYLGGMVDSAFASPNRPAIVRDVPTPLYVQGPGGELIYVGLQHVAVRADGSQQVVVVPDQQGLEDARNRGTGGLVDITGQELPGADQGNPLGIFGGGQPVTVPDPGSDPLSLDDLYDANGQPLDEPIVATPLAGGGAGTSHTDAVAATGAGTSGTTGAGFTSGVQPGPDNSVVVDLTALQGGNADNPGLDPTYPLDGPVFPIGDGGTDSIGNADSENGDVLPAVADQPSGIFASMRAFFGDVKVSQKASQSVQFGSVYWTISWQDNQTSNSTGTPVVNSVNQPNR